MIYFCLFILGAVLGSFYLVIGLRRPLNESIITPRSHCDSCSHTLKWYELIPIVSYILQKGHCRVCKAKIPFIYPLIEIISGLLFVLSYYIFGFNYQTLLMLLICSLLIIIYISDFKYFIILDGPLIIISILILIVKFYFQGFNTLIYSIVVGLVMVLIMFIIKLIGDKVFKRESLGGGDIKLAFVMGVILGFKLALISLILASFIALPYAIYLIIKKQGKEMPFGPFLITSLLIVFIFSPYINDFLKMFYL